MMKSLANSFAARFGMAGAIASAMLFASPVWAQSSRLSLADRVTHLEQQAQNKDQSGTGMVNQMLQLQAQVQQLQGQIEELQHHVRTLEDKNKAQYADLDARLARIESGAASGTPVAAAQTADKPAPTSANSGGSAAGTQPASSTGAVTGDPVDAQAAYDVAFKSIRGGNYVEAAREFRHFIEQYPDHPLAPNAWYWLGESYYATTNYSVALQSFQQLLSQFPESDKAPDALLKVGYSQLELKQVPAARSTLTEVKNKYPGSKVASLAAERLQRLQLQTGN